MTRRKSAVLRTDTHPIKLSSVVMLYTPNGGQTEVYSCGLYPDHGFCSKPILLSLFCKLLRLWPTGAGVWAKACIVAREPDMTASVFAEF